MLSFTAEEIQASVDFYADKLSKQPKLDFNKPLTVLIFRTLCNLGYLSKTLKQRGFEAERRRVRRDGQKFGLRIIRPKGPAKGLVVDIHGGGWTLAKALNSDPQNVEFAEAGFAVVSVDYDYAPGTKFETVIAQATAATAWALENAQAQFGTENVFLNGDSAGAHLSLCAAQRLKVSDHYDRLRGMVLRYGCYDLSATPSVRAAGPDTLVMYAPSLPDFFQKVTRRSGEAALRDPKISPLYGAFDGLPPTLLVVGTGDPLTDDSKLAAQKMAAAGVAHELVVVPHAPHSFDRYPTGVADTFNAYARDWIANRS